MGRRGGIGVRLHGLVFLVSVVASIVAGPAPAKAEPNAEVLAPGATIREAPDAAARVIMTLEPGTRVEVAFTQRGPGGEWAQIILPAGGNGFAQNQSLRRLTNPPAWRETSSSAGVLLGGKTEGRGWVKLRREGNVFLVPARLNRQMETLLVLDTGASSVTISQALAARLGLEPVGPPRPLMTANGVTNGRRVVLDSIHLPDESGPGASQVEGMLVALPGFPKQVGGLLGQTFLRRFRVSIDAERLILHLEPQ